MQRKSHSNHAIAQGCGRQTKRQGTHPGAKKANYRDYLQLSAIVCGKPSAGFLPFTLRTPQRSVLYAIDLAAFPDITISGLPAAR